MPFKLYSKFIGVCLFHMESHKEYVIDRFFINNNIFRRDFCNLTAINTIRLNQILILINNVNTTY